MYTFRYKFLLLFICLCFLFHHKTIRAQVLETNFGETGFWTDITGKPLKFSVDYKLEGSPFYFEEYRVANIVLMNGKKYFNIPVKIDIPENLVLIKPTDSSEIQVETPIQSVTFYQEDLINNKKDSIVLIAAGQPINQPNTKIFELLYKGNAATLFKLISITFSDIKGYGESTLTRTFKRSTYLYVQTKEDSIPIRLSKNKSFIASLFNEQRKEVVTYIEKEKLDCRDTKDILRIFQYADKIIPQR